MFFRKKKANLAEVNTGPRIGDYLASDGIRDDSSLESESTDSYGRPNVSKLFDSIGYPLSRDEETKASVHPIISRLISIPADDAVRNGWRYDFGEGVSDFLVSRIEEMHSQLSGEISKFIKYVRTHGIGFLLPVWKFCHDDGREDLKSLKQFYEDDWHVSSLWASKGDFLGMVALSPHEVTPLEIDHSPISLSHKEPLFWSYEGFRIHRSHIVVGITHEMPGSYKSMYRYGGPSIPQLVQDAVYRYERASDELINLMVTKRTRVLILPEREFSSVMRDKRLSKGVMSQIHKNSDSHHMLIGPSGSDIKTLDTSLSDSAVVAEHFKKDICMPCGIPVTRLAMTSSVGLNSTGEGDMRNYHEMVEGVQEKYVSPAINMFLDSIKMCHGEDCKIRFELMPITSRSMEQEMQQRKSKAEVDAIYISAGVLDQREVRESIIRDKSSGYQESDLNEELYLNGSGGDMLEEAKGMLDE